MDAMFNADPNLTLLGAFNNHDAGTKLIQSRNIVPVPHRYVRHFIRGPLTPRQAWEIVGQDITTSNDTVPCLCASTQLPLTGMYHKCLRRHRFNLGPGHHCRAAGGRLTHSSSHGVSPAQAAWTKPYPHYGRRPTSRNQSQQTGTGTEGGAGGTKRTPSPQQRQGIRRLLRGEPTSSREQILCPPPKFCAWWYIILYHPKQFSHLRRRSMRIGTYHLSRLHNASVINILL
jgi:hypothetical protein